MDNYVEQPEDERLEELEVDEIGHDDQLLIEINTKDLKAYEGEGDNPNVRIFKTKNCVANTRALVHDTKMKDETSAYDEDQIVVAPEEKGL